MLANLVAPKSSELKLNNRTLKSKDTIRIRSVPIEVVNHPLVKAGMTFMEKINTIHRESLLSSTYSMTQIEVLLKHFVSQSQNASPQQCKAAQIILSGWAKMLWQQMSDDTVEKISSIVNYCLQFPQDHAPLLLIAFRCLNDLVVDPNHPLAPVLNDVAFVLEQQGLTSNQPSFIQATQEPTFRVNQFDWSKSVLKCFSSGILFLSLSQMWLDSSWQMLLA